MTYFVVYAGIPVCKNKLSKQDAPPPLFFSKLNNYEVANNP